MGPSAGFKYQFLGRERSSVGLAVQWSFSWQAAKNANEVYNSFVQEVRLLADWQLAPDWFAAVNFAYAPGFDIYANAPTECTHTVELSASVVKRLSDRYFIGAELRHLARYQSAFGELDETAVYLGPTVLARFDAGYLGLAWSARVMNETPGSSSFGEQQFRLKAGLVF